MRCVTDDHDSASAVRVGNGLHGPPVLCVGSRAVHRVGSPGGCPGAAGVAREYWRVRARGVRLVPRRILTGGRRAVHGDGTATGRDVRGFVLVPGRGAAVVAGLAATGCTQHARSYLPWWPAGVCAGDAVRAAA